VAKKSARRPRRTRRAASSPSTSSLRALERQTEALLKTLWVKDPAVVWADAPALLASEGTRLPVPGIKHLHLATRQAVATEEAVLDRRPVRRATLLIEWKPTGKGRGSPAFRDPKTGKIRTTLRQLRSVLLPQDVPADEVREWILGTGRHKGRKRIAETLGPEVSGGKLKLKDIVAVIPRSKTGKTASALREYFAERIVPRLLAGRRRWSAERVVIGQMQRHFARELRELMRAEPPSTRTSRRSSSRRSRASRTSSSRKRSRRSRRRR
jgi:hypothetical protein